MPKLWKIVVGLGFAALIGFIIYSATGLAQVSCTVCVEFHGRTSCQPAAGTSQDEAVKTADSVACAASSVGLPRKASSTVAFKGAEPNARHH